MYSLYKIMYENIQVYRMYNKIYNIVKYIWNNKYNELEIFEQEIFEQIKFEQDKIQWRRNVRKIEETCTRNVWTIENTLQEIIV